MPASAASGSRWKLANHLWFAYVHAAAWWIKTIQWRQQNWKKVIQQSAVHIRSNNVEQVSMLTFFNHMASWKPYVLISIDLFFHLLPFGPWGSSGLWMLSAHLALWRLQSHLATVMVMHIYIFHYISTMSEFIYVGVTFMCNIPYPRTSQEVVPPLVSSNDDDDYFWDPLMDYFSRDQTAVVTEQHPLPAPWRTFCQSMHWSWKFGVVRITWCSPETSSHMTSA